MGGVIDELNLHASYAAKLGIDLPEVQPLRATRAYTDFLLRTAWHCGVDEITAAIVAQANSLCSMRLYAFLGTELAEDRRSDNPYNDWITTYSGKGFQALAAEVESLLNALAEDAPKVRDAYHYAMECALDFCSAPLEHTP